MTDFVEINGAWIDRSYFEENVDEAKQREWSSLVEVSDDHVHCMVCGAAILQGKTGVQSAKSWLCEHCMTYFVNEKG